MKEKYSCYEFKVLRDTDYLKHWLYIIYDTNYKNDIIRESDEWFDTFDLAKLSACQHIDLLENGEG